MKSFEELKGMVLDGKANGMAVIDMTADVDADLTGYSDPIEDTPSESPALKRLEPREEPKRVEGHAAQAVHRFPSGNGVNVGQIAKMLSISKAKAKLLADKGTFKEPRFENRTFFYDRELVVNYRENQTIQKDTKPMTTKSKRGSKPTKHVQFKDTVPVGYIGEEAAAEIWGSTVNGLGQARNKGKFGDTMHVDGAHYYNEKALREAAANKRTPTGPAAKTPYTGKKRGPKPKIKTGAPAGAPAPLPASVAPAVRANMLEVPADTLKLLMLGVQMTLDENDASLEVLRLARSQMARHIPQ